MSTHSPTRYHASSVCRLINLARCQPPLTEDEIQQESKVARTTEITKERAPYRFFFPTEHSFQQQQNDMIKVRHENYLETRIKELQERSSPHKMDLSQNNSSCSPMKQMVHMRQEEQEEAKICPKKTLKKHDGEGTGMCSSDFSCSSGGSSESAGDSENYDRCSGAAILSRKNKHRLNDLRKQSHSHERNRANVINDRKRESSFSTEPRREESGNIEQARQ